jgi:hypothetical protein
MTLAFPLPVVAQMQASLIRPRPPLPPPRLSVAPLRLPIPRGCDKRGWYSHRKRSASCRQHRAPRYRMAQIPMWRHTCPRVRLWRPLPPPRNRCGLIQISRPTRPALTVDALLLIIHLVRLCPRRPRLPRLPRRLHRPRHRRCVAAASRRVCGKCSATARIRVASSSDARDPLPIPALPPRHPRPISRPRSDAISLRGPTTRRTPRALRKCGGVLARPRGIASSAPEGRYSTRVRWVEYRWVDYRDRQGSEYIAIHFHRTNTRSNNQSSGPVSDACYPDFFTAENSVSTPHISSSIFIPILICAQFGALSSAPIASGRAASATAGFCRRSPSSPIIRI